MSDQGTIPVEPWKGGDPAPLKVPHMGEAKPVKPKRRARDPKKRVSVEPQPPGAVIMAPTSVKPLKWDGKHRKYDPSICAKLVELMGLGFSVTAVAGYFAVSRDTLHQWSEEHPEFGHALNIGRSARLFRWEAEHIRITEGGDGNVAGTIFALKNAAPDEWRDKREEIIRLDMTDIDDVAIAQRVAFLLTNGVPRLPKP